jgi:hypothetical protein
MRRLFYKNPVLIAVSVEFAPFVFLNGCCLSLADFEINSAFCKRTLFYNQVVN